MASGGDIYHGEFPGECRWIYAGELSDVDWWYLMMVNDITTGQVILTEDTRPGND